MTIILDLEAEEVAALSAQADAQRVDIVTVLHGLVAQVSRPQEPQTPLTTKQQSALALLDAWAAEKEHAAPEERAQNEVEFEEFKANINRWRAEEGRGPAFL